MKQHLILISFILMTSFLIFKPSFSLAFTGDDWLEFWRYKYSTEWSEKKYTHFTYFFTPYGSQESLMAILYKIFGYNPLPFYILSFILRSITVITLYTIIYLVNKNKYVAFWPSLLFSVSSTGLETTNWVFNMPTYLALTLWLIFFFYFYKTLTQKFYPNILISAILFYTSYIVSPIRMHGLLGFAIVSILFLIIQKRDVKTLKISLKSLFILSLTFFLVRYSGRVLGDFEDFMRFFINGISAMANHVGEQNFGFILYPFVMIGQSFLPELFWKFIDFPSYLGRFLLICFFSTIFILPFIYEIVKDNLGKTKKYMLFVIMLCLIVWIFLTFTISKSTQGQLITPSFLGPSILGGMIFIIGIIGSLVFIKRDISKILFMSLIWILFSFLFPWVLNPTAAFENTHRYMIVTIVGTCLLWSVFLKVLRLRDSHINVPLIFFLILSIIIHAATTYSYFSHFKQIRSSELNDKIWRNFSNLEFVKETSQPQIFYFEGEYEVLYWNITFGFPAHMAMIYGLKNGNKLPIPMSDLKDVVSALKDGHPLPAFGYKMEPISIDRIYAYYISNDGNVTDITSQVRKKLAFP